MKKSKSKAKSKLSQGAREVPQEVRKIEMVEIAVNKPKDLNFLYNYIHKYHTIPNYVMPTKTDLMNPAHKFFRAIVVLPREKKGLIVGISGYQIRTPFLVETEKTIIDPEFRGQGWGRLVSEGIEAEVKRAGFKKIRSTIYADNYAMINIKLAQGYVIEGYHPDHDAPGLHEYSLGKRLS